MSIRSILLVVLAFFFLSCDQAESPLGPEVPEPFALLSIVDGSAPDGLPGFYFRPPIVPGPMAGEGEFDSSLLDLLAVEVCEWTGEACALPLIRRITSGDRPPERLRMNEAAGFYRALWNTRRDNLDPEKTYRVRVLASGGELGHADVDVVEKDDGTWNSHNADMVRLVKGEGLPIAFRIEEGLGERVGPDDRMVVLGDGAVSLELPEGALGEGGPEVFLTASPAKDLPPDLPPIIPGTAWDFGPDGLVFDEPVWMTISYNPADLPPGTDPNELRIHKLVNGEFVQMDAGLVDDVNHTVSALVEGFSLYVLIERLYPGSPEDVTFPLIHSMTVLDETAGTFGASTTLELSSSDDVLTSRLHLTDDISGVERITVYYVSPAGTQYKFPCYTWPLHDPISGSDTNGDWECTSNWPQYSEAGTWKPMQINLQDKVGNYGTYRTYYGSTEGELCDGYGTEANCIDDLPDIVVVSDPSDVTPPVLHSFDVSHDVEPRVFASTVTVDVSENGSYVVFGIQATDDLSGIEPFGPNDSHNTEYIQIRLEGPSGQSRYWPSCTLVEGSTTDGSWDCRMWIPEDAENGIWKVSYIRLPDRVGSGNYGGYDYYWDDGAGNVCNLDGECVSAPTVVVSSEGDGEAPFLQWLGFSLTEATVNITMGVTDVGSGTTSVQPLVRSALTTQYHRCYATLTSGDSMNGGWECSITLPEFSAKGPWYFTLSLYDASGNSRSYYRRPEDGYLCYNTDLGDSICKNYGPTDIVVQ